MSVIALIGLNRRIGAEIYRWLIDTGDAPGGIILPRQPDEFALEAAADAERRGIPTYRWGEALADSRSLVRDTGATLFLSIHFPEILPTEWLIAFRDGCVNLHPGFLPWGRGWHTPTWAILEGTPFGATMHYMTAEVDRGPVIAQQALRVEPCDTAHSLYTKALDAEYRLFQATWPTLRDRSGQAVVQCEDAGSMHGRRDLDDRVRRLDLDEVVPVRALLRRLRALTTDRWSEAAWFEENGTRYAVRVELRPHDE